MLYLQRREGVMEKYISLLGNTKLFQDVAEEDIIAMLGCLQVRKQTLRKGEYVLRQGEHLNDIIILVEGNLHEQQDDYWGNRSIISSIGVGDIYGEAYVGKDSGSLLNDVVAVEDSVVLFFNVLRLINVCSSACRFHTMVVQNLFLAISEKNRQLLQKLGHMSKRSTREKLISYLSEEAKKQNSGTIILPFNRQQMADFLSVDRSAMSSELGKMRGEGLIEFEKNRFTLLMKNEQ